MVLNRSALLNTTGTYRHKSLGSLYTEVNVGEHTVVAVVTRCQCDGHGVIVSIDDPLLTSFRHFDHFVS